MIYRVLPAYNEEANIQYMFEKLTQELLPLPLDYAIMFINHGSSDCKFQGTCTSFYNMKSNLHPNFLFDTSKADEYNAP